MAENMAEINKKVVGAFAESVFVKKDISAVEKYVRADYIQHNPLVNQGANGFKEFFSTWFASVPDWHYTLKKIVAEGNEAWVYGTYTGTLKKDWLGIAASGQKYAFDAVDIFRIQDGKLAEHWDVMDIYGLFKQLGAIK
ncbi:MAG: ester cyclase [Deltaproteobacteria bacterium]|nr:ester cyclase [Deltaproteobacteria bacterium]